MPVGKDSCDETEVASTWAAVERSKAADSVYSFISSPPLPITNILVPSFENAMPRGKDSFDNTLKGGETKMAVESIKGSGQRVFVYLVSAIAYREHLGAVV